MVGGGGSFIFWRKGFTDLYIKVSYRVTVFWVIGISKKLQISFKILIIILLLSLLLSYILKLCQNINILTYHGHYKTSVPHLTEICLATLTAVFTVHCNKMAGHAVSKFTPKIQN